MVLQFGKMPKREEQETNRKAQVLGRREFLKKALLASAGICIAGLPSLSLSGCGMDKNEKKKYAEELARALGRDSKLIGKKRLLELAELSKEYGGLSAKSMAEIVRIRASLEGKPAFENKPPTEELVLETLLYNTEWIREDLPLGPHNELFQKQIDVAEKVGDIARAKRLTRITQILDQFFTIPYDARIEISEKLAKVRPSP
ncbi:MAG: hypothetical protein QW275_01525 [Candidatus Anstonellaceae archaeon]